MTKKIDKGDFDDFHAALNEAWKEVELMWKGEETKGADIWHYYNSAKKQIKYYPEEAAKTLALGLAKKTKLIEKWL